MEDALAWAREEFGGVRLPDIRLNRRLVEVAACIRENPRGTLPRAFEDRAALKGAYRLLSHDAVSHKEVLRSHVERTREACHEPGEYLLIEDTTALSFSQRGSIGGMGPLSDEYTQGLLAHTCLAARIEHWADVDRPVVTLCGVFGQECWAREIPQGTRAARKKVKRKSTKKSCPRESDRWGRSLRETDGPPKQVSWTLVADRECDIFEVMTHCAEQGSDWVIRAAQRRKTLPLDETIFESMDTAPVLGDYTIALRARPGVRARTAQVELRAHTVAIRPKREFQSRYAPLQTGLVEVRETNPPPGVAPIHWLLLTSWPCASFEQARRVAAAYSVRWLIEEYHKALKTGTKIEDTQLSSAERIEVLLAIHAVIAVTLLELKLVANARPDAPIDDQRLAPESLRVLEQKYGHPDQGWTNKTLLHTIARMGGYLGRKNDGPPGWLTIWRGWQKLTLMTQGYLLAIHQQNCG